MILLKYVQNRSFYGTQGNVVKCYFRYLIAFEPGSCFFEEVRLNLLCRFDVELSRLNRILITANLGVCEVKYVEG